MIEGCDDGTFEVEFTWPVRIKVSAPDAKAAEYEARRQLPYIKAVGMFVDFSIGFAEVTAVREIEEASNGSRAEVR